MAALIETWHDTDHEVPSGTVADLFETQVARTPDAIAVVSDGAELTYAELNAQGNRLARLLVAHGLGPERVAAVVVPRSEWLVIAFLAVLKAGGTYLPIDLRLPSERVSFMLGEAEPTLVLTTQELAANGRFNGIVGPTVFVDGASELSDENLTDSDRTSPLTSDTPFFLLYTSGSTGRPKGVLMCTSAMVNLISWHLSALPSGPGRTTALYAPLSFDPTIQETLSMLLSGGALAVPSDDVRAEPERLVRWLEERRVTDWYAPTTVVHAVCQTALDKGRKLPDLMHIAQGGEQLTLTDTVTAFCAMRPGRVVSNIYGPTETHAATTHLLDGPVAGWPDSAPIGKPIWNAKVHVLDAQLAPVEIGAVGELYVAGAGLARGYHRNPALTAERFIANPFGPPGSRMYRTGDVVRWRHDGMLDFLGRTDHQIKIRGVRVEIGEVEAVIRRVRGVRDVTLVVAGTGSARHVAAYLIADSGHEEVTDRVRESLRRELPAEMVPASLHVVEKFPLNPNGKIDRTALSALTAGVARAPRGEREQALCRLFAEALGRQTVGIDDNFFELGGHSLLVAWLAGKVRTELGLDLKPVDMLRNPTVLCLAKFLDGARTAKPPMALVPRPQSVPASPVQRQLWFIDRLAGPSALYNVPLLMRLSGNVDVQALHDGLADVVARHESLRTVFVPVDGLPHQRVITTDMARPALDLITAEPEELDHVVLTAASRPFDLTAELPVRATLIGVAHREWVLLLSVHHIVCDGWSLRPLVRDLAAAYNARRAGRHPQWTPLPLHYADYTLWRQRVFGDSDDETENRRMLIDFWRGALDGAPEVIRIPADRPHPAVRDGRGERIEWRLPPASHRRLADRAGRQSCTVFMVVHAAVTTLLSRAGAGDDVVIGATVAGREDDVLADLVGLFVNTLPLRVRTSGAPTFEDLLDRVREADLAAFAHQDLSFEQIVDAVNPKRSSAHSPLVQVMLAFQTEDLDPPRMAGLHTEYRTLDPKVAKFDLTFDITEQFGEDGSRAGMRGHLEFATDVFDRETVAVLLRDFLDLLESMGTEC